MRLRQWFSAESACQAAEEKMLGILFGAMSYTVIDKIIVALKMDSLINDAIKGIILIVVIMIQIVSPRIREKFRKDKRASRRMEVFKSRHGVPISNRYHVCFACIYNIKYKITIWL